MDFTATHRPAMLPAHEVAAVLAHARQLQQAQASGAVAAPLLHGKRIALLCQSDTDPDAALFRSAASALGAQVSHIVPRFAPAVTPHEMSRTGLMFGRLYDAVECQGVAPEQVQQLSDAAGVPVFDGLARAGYLPEPGVDPKGGPALPAIARRFIVQAVLVASLR